MDMETKAAVEGPCQGVYGKKGVKNKQEICPNQDIFNILIKLSTIFKIRRQKYSPSYLSKDSLYLYKGWIAACLHSISSDVDTLTRIVAIRRKIFSNKSGFNVFI